MSNACCETCPLAHKAINGRYCREHNTYVEHQRTPLCDAQKQ